MKKSVILDIFHGFRGHIETMDLCNFKSDASNIVSDLYDELEKKLSPETLDLVQEFIEALEKNWSMEIDFYFREGVKLGVNLGLECAE